MATSSLLPSQSFAQITGSEVSSQRTLPLHEQVDDQTKNSRYRLGPLYLIPVFSIGNAGYVSNIFGTEAAGRSDFTASASLGTQWIVPFGPNVFLRGIVTPSYIWYAHAIEARKLGWTADQSLLFLFNRLSIETKGNSSRSSSTLNSETDRRVLQTVTDGLLNFELEATSHIVVIGGGEAHRYRFEESPPLPPNSGLPPASVLDRTESAARGGVRYRFSTVFALDATYEKTRVEFPQTAAHGDSETTGYLLGIQGDGNHFVVHLSGGYREGKPFRGSEVPPYKTLTGSYGISWQPTEKLTFRLYGHRQTQYSLFTAYYFENLNGGGFSFLVGRRVSLNAFGEFGTNDYPRADLFAGRRHDRVTGYGGGFGLRVTPQLQLSLQGNERRYSSNVAGLSRNVFQINGGLTLQLSRGISFRAGAA